MLGRGKAFTKQGRERNGVKKYEVDSLLPMATVRRQDEEQPAAGLAESLAERQTRLIKKGLHQAYIKEF